MALPHSSVRSMNLKGTGRCRKWRKGARVKGEAHKWSWRFSLWFSGNNCFFRWHVQWAFWWENSFMSFGKKDWCSFSLLFWKLYLIIHLFGNPNHSWGYIASLEEWWRFICRGQTPNKPTSDRIRQTDKRSVLFRPVFLDLVRIRSVKLSGLVKLLCTLSVLPSFIILP